MPALKLKLQGRFGNQVCQYLWARAVAEYYNYDLVCAEWIGEKIFRLPPVQRDATIQESMDNLNELTIEHRLRQGWDVGFMSYGQMPVKHNFHMPYTVRQAREWLRFQSNVEDARSDYETPVVLHRRVGDYIGYGYPVVSESSYARTCMLFQINIGAAQWVTEETAWHDTRFQQWAPFLPDFLRLCWSRVLLRGNSTFSFVAGLLSNGIVLSPVIDGKEGGKEHDCQFVVGNHPRLANLDFTQDMHVAP